MHLRQRQTLIASSVMSSERGVSFFVRRHIKSLARWQQRKYSISRITSPYKYWIRLAINARSMHMCKKKKIRGEFSIANFYLISTFDRISDIIINIYIYISNTIGIEKCVKRLFNENINCEANFVEDVFMLRIYKKTIGSRYDCY